MVSRSASGGEKFKVPEELQAGTTPDGFQGRKFFRRNCGDLENFEEEEIFS